MIDLHWKMDIPASCYNWHGWSWFQKGKEVAEMNLDLGEIQARFVEIVWAREPIGSGELVRLCDQEFGWKKSTTYTVLKKICEKGILQNEGGTVTSLISKEEYYARKSKQFVEETFQGSLPAFLASFSAGKRLSDEEVEELQRMIDVYREKKDE